MQDVKSSQTQADKSDSTDGVDSKDDAASVDLGAMDSSPFVFRSYEKDFTCKPEYINGTGETTNVFLVSFTLELAASRVNGIYPVIVNVTGKDENGIEVQKSVQNLVATVNVPSADIELKNDSNTIFVGKIGTQKTTDLTLKFHVSKSTADGNYPIEIAMSYDDPKATTFSSTGNFVVTVEQPLDVKLTMSNIEKNVTVGDTIPLTFQVLNLGRSTVYNVRCDVTGDGLSQTKTAFIGNMESGTAGEGEMNLFITTLEGGSRYGETTGTVTLTYEDDG